MKAVILFFACLVFSGCISHANSVADADKSIQPTPTIENSNANNASRYAYTTYQYDKSLLDKLNAENERFRQAPDEFKSVDFKNFNYVFGRLKDGEFEHSEFKNPPYFDEQYYLEDVFYVDLMGNAKKEAVVLIYRISCGGSCDGGADNVYFYSSHNGKPQLIDILETGSNSGGCSLKSLIIKDKKINVEQFGRCLKDSKFDSESTNVCKFCTKDETQSVYSIDKNGLKHQSANVGETEVVNVMDSPAFISINE